MDQLPGFHCDRGNRKISVKIKTLLRRYFPPFFSARKEKNVSASNLTQGKGKQLIEGFPADSAPRFLVRDRDQVCDPAFLRKKGILVQSSLLPIIEVQIRLSLIENVGKRVAHPASCS